MTPRIFVLAAAAAIWCAAPRTVTSQAIPDKAAKPVVPATPAATPDSAKPAVPATAAAPASPTAAPDTSSAFDPVGTYVVYITAQGNAMTTTTRIDKNADGTYAGTLTGDGIPPLPVNSVKVEGNKVTLSVTAPDGTEAIVEMVVKGQDITGQWSMANDGSTLTGKKSPDR